MLKGSLWRRGECCADVLEIENSFRGEAVFGEVLGEGGGEEAAVDEEGEWCRCVLCLA